MNARWFVLLLAAAAPGIAGADPLKVISNGMTANEGYPAEMTRWYERNLPELPADYVETAGFVHYEPIQHYVDAVNWSLLPLAQFQEIGKGRWARVPEGRRIVRDAATGAWAWPVGAETAKLLRARVRDASGREVMRDLELRLARKITDDPDPRKAWAMGVYVRGEGGRWKAVRSPDLRLVVDRAVTPTGGIRRVNYPLTPPEACMTCHSRAAASPVDFKRGDDFVYGANEELFTGRSRLRLSRYLADAETRKETRELARDEAEDWIDVETLDREQVLANRKAFAPLIEGGLLDLD